MVITAESGINKLNKWIILRETDTFRWNIFSLGMDLNLKVQCTRTRSDTAWLTCWTLCVDKELYKNLPQEPETWQIMDAGGEEASIRGSASITGPGVRLLSDVAGNRHGFNLTGCRLPQAAKAPKRR